MKLNKERLAALAEERGWNLSKLLNKADVSRTAFYSLTRSETLLPRSILALADVLNVSPEEFLTFESKIERKIRRLQRKADLLKENFPESEWDNFWHTLLLLEEHPIKRLERSLARGRNIHRR